MSFINSNLLEYINSMHPPFEELLEKVRCEAVENKVPIIPTETARLLAVLISVSKPTNILEIGCAVGFSTGLMASCIPSHGKITTIERQTVMADKAKLNYKFMGIEDKITLLEGDANDILPTLTEIYDFIFVDAAKGQYINFLPECLRLLKKDGILVADNILQKGTIASSIDEIPRRQRTIYRRLREFTWTILHTEGLESSIIPIGDGLSITHKLQDDIVLTKNKGEIIDGKN